MSSSIDLRSDTVTKPTAAMRDAMAQAAVGDDVFGDDPTINALEAKVAKLAGKPAALLCSSGTQSNLIAILSHCQRGEEYLVGQEYHTYRYEGGGAAVLGGVVPQTIELEDDGTIDLAMVEKRIKPDDPHFPITRLLALENTQTGRVIPQHFMLQARELVNSYNLQLHLDGARLWNAAVASGMSIAELAAPFDSVSLCCSKGLGAPVGSLLCGDERYIQRARRWRKMLGGGMRQAGVLAAAIDYALDHHVERLAEDHTNAQKLAAGLSGKIAEQWRYSVESAQTNMVYLNFESSAAANKFAAHCAAHHIVVPSSERMRLVTHLDVTEQNIDDLLSILNNIK